MLSFPDFVRYPPNVIPNIAQFLAEYGANAETQDQGGCTPLKEAS